MLFIQQCIFEVHLALCKTGCYTFFNCLKKELTLSEQQYVHVGVYFLFRKTNQVSYPLSTLYMSIFTRHGCPASVQQHTDSCSSVHVYGQMIQLAVHSVPFRASPAPQLKDTLHKLTTIKIIHVFLNDFGSKLGPFTK